MPAPPRGPARAAAAAARGAELRPGVCARVWLGLSGRRGGADVDVSGCTHAFMSSVCFDDRVLRAVSEKLAAAPGFRLLVTLRSIPLQPHLRPLGAVRLANTFHGSHPAFLYVKNTPQGLADAPPGPPAPRPPRAPVHPPSSPRVALRPCARAAAEAAGRARAAEALAAIMCHDGACWLPPHLQESSESLLVAEP